MLDKVLSENAKKLYFSNSNISNKINKIITQLLEKRERLFEIKDKKNGIRIKKSGLACGQITI